MRIPQSIVASSPPPCAACRLRTTGAFNPVAAEELAFIESFRSSILTRQADSTLIREQKPGGKLFTLYAGWAFRYKSLSDGRRQILNFLPPGDLIGLQQEFSDSAMRGIEAVTDVSLCVFPRAALWEVFRSHSRLGYNITWLAGGARGRHGRRQPPDHRPPQCRRAGRHAADAPIPAARAYRAGAMKARSNFRSTSSTSPIPWACRWCTPTKPCGA